MRASATTLIACAGALLSMTTISACSSDGIAPGRSTSDIVPTSVTSVDVLTVRHNPEMHQGAPTVHRTLSGAPARALAEAVNHLPVTPPGTYNCPDMVIGERSYDQLVFHGGGRVARAVVNLASCRNVRLTAGDRRPIELGSDPAASRVDHQILAAIGLPSSYGEQFPTATP